MKHADLVEAARRWLWQRCSIVITEMANGGGEEADAVGWTGTECILVECKASYDDFMSDAHKTFRQFPELGIGSLRYYFAPPGVIRPGVLSYRWGLLEWNGRSVRQVVPAQRMPEYNQHKEILMLMSALRRTGTYAPSGVSVRIYKHQTKCRATLSVDDTDYPYDFQSLEDGFGI